MTKDITKRQILSALTTIILFFIISLTIVPIVTSAATPDIYVNQTGWWYDGGSFNASITPIQFAINNATAGNLIYVYNGSYTENVNVDKQLTLQGEGADVVSVTAALTSDHVFYVSTDYVNISGFNVSGATGSGFIGRAGICMHRSNYCNISDNNVSGNYIGINLPSLCSYNTISNNTANSNSNHGIYLGFSSNYNTISNNTISNNTNRGIYLDSSSSNTIYNNYFNNIGNANDNGVNIWNTTPATGTNIIGGSWLGGNYWSNYAGADTDGDGLGDTWYNTSIITGGDYHPLVDTPPTITISSPLEGQSYNTSTVSLNVTADETIDTWLYNINGTANVIFTPNTTLPSLPDGIHNVTVYANDSAGNIGSASVNFTVDTTPPTAPTIDVPTDGSTLTSAITWVNGTIDADTTNVTVYVNGSATNDSVAASSTFNISSVPLGADGDYEINVFAKDAAGNVNTTNTTVTVTVDTTLPIVTFESPTPVDNSNLSQNYIETNVTVVETNLKNVTTYLYNGTGFVDSNVSTSSPLLYNFTNLDDGTYYINATAYDLIGNSNVTETRTIVLDTTLPIATFESPTPADNSNLSQNYIDINVTVVETNLKNVTTYLYNGTGLLDSNVSASSPLLYNFTNLDDGTYYINATAYDLIGNSNVTETRTIVLDTTLPIATFESPTPADNSNLSQNYIDINVSVDEDNFKNVTTYLYNGTGFVNFNVSTLSPLLYNFTNLDDGTYYINATAYDLIGNSNVTETRTIVLDMTSPIATFESPTPADNSNLSQNYIETNVTVVETNVKNVTTYLYNSKGLVDSNVSTSSPLLYNFTNLDDGTYYINATAYDLIGNSNVTETRTIMLDMTSPIATFESPTPADNSNLSQNYIDINVSVDETNLKNVTTYLYNGTGLVDSNVSTLSPLLYNFTNLDDGTYYINATAYDLAGNLNVTETRTIMLDTIAPVSPTITVPTNGATLNISTIWVNGTKSVDTTNVTVYVNGSATNDSVAVSGTTYNISNVPLGADGIHEINVSAMDLAGNINTTNATAIVIVDTTAPDMPTIDMPTNGAILNTSITWVNGTISADTANVTVYVNGSATNDSVAVSGTSYNISNVPLGVDGDYEINVSAKDAAGNVNTTNATVTVIVDTTPPDTPTICVPTDGELLTSLYTWVNGTISADTTNVTIYVNGSITNTSVSVSGTTFNISNVPLGVDGNYEINVSAKDVAGNVNTTNATVTVTVDTIVPIITITTPTTSSKAYKSGGQQMYVNFKYVEANPKNYTIQIHNDTDIINSATATTTSSPVNVSFTMNATAADGYYNVTVTMWDNASNTNSSTAVDSVSMDTTPPTAPTNLVHTDDAPDGYDNDNSTDISWSAATDLYSTVTYRIYRDGIFNNSTTLLAFTFTNETEGQHTYNVSAIDSAGNINTTNATVTIIVDYTDPVIHNVSLSDESPAYDQTIIITVNVTDDYLSNVTAGGTNLTHQSGALWNGTITADYGTNVVTVTAYDNASNSATNTNLSYTGPAAPTDDISSGGVNYPTPLPENVVNNEVKGTIFNEPVSSADLKFTKGYIISVTVDAKGTISEVLVTIQKLVGRPSEIKVAPPSGAVHTYHNIDLGRIENGDLAGANIKFRAEKKWIADNGGDRNAVVVMRYHDGWEALETKPIGEDNEYVFFSARTLGFSTFAITMQLEEGEAVPVEIQTSEPVVEEVVVDEVVPEPDEGTSYWWLVLVMIAIIVVGVVFFIYRNKKDESEYR